MTIFQTGRIRYKSGSNATFVYTIDNRVSLKEKVIPFYETYVNKYGCKVKKNRCIVFKKLLQLLKQKAHCNLDGLVFQILPLWDELRIQVDKSNQKFTNLQEAQTFVKKHIKNQKQI